MACFSLWQIACVLSGICLTLFPELISSCGGYRDGLKPGQSFRLTSPNYPNAYPRNQRCIWLFAASTGTGFVVNVTSVSLEGSGNNASGCLDYLQITEGSSTANELAYLCKAREPQVFNLERLYLWVKFQSNHQMQGVGFDMTVLTVQNSNAANNGTPVASCNLTRYTCPNKECVFQGSLCDNVNDCGCIDYGCDETRCWKFEMLEDSSMLWGIGTSIGLTIVIFAFVTCGFLEMPERKRPECLRVQAAKCSAICTRKNRVQQQTAEDAFMAMMKRMAGDKEIRWDGADSETESSRTGTPSRSISPTTGASTPSVSRRSSVYTPGAPPLYGNTLSPKDSIKVTAGSAKVAQQQQQQQPQQQQRPAATTLTVPNVSKA